MKNKIKIFIALGISLITTLIFMVNTYAYQSDRLSYTLTFNQTIGDINYYNINEPLQTTDDKSNYVLMINYTYNSQATANIYISWQWANGTTAITNLSNTSNNRNVNNNGITTLIHKFGYFNTQNIINSIGIQYQSGYTINDVVNIDLVKLDEIWIGDYVEVYVNNYTSQLEQDIEELQEQYDTLSDNYETLEENYQTLSDNYETLEEDYEVLQDSTQENGFYKNVSEAIFWQGSYYVEPRKYLNKENAYKYMSISTMNINEYLSANEIEYNTYYGYGERCGIEIQFTNPINISGFTYYISDLMGSLDNDNDPTNRDYYIAFLGYQTNSVVKYFNEMEEYKIEIPNGFMCRGIEMYWYNTDQQRGWPDKINASEYDRGYREGQSTGYTNGYNAGQQRGIQQGIEQGIQQADSRVNTRIAPHM